MALELFPQTPAVSLHNFSCLQLSLLGCRHALLRERRVSLVYALDLDPTQRSYYVSSTRSCIPLSIPLSSKLRPKIIISFSSSPNSRRMKHTTLFFAQDAFVLLKLFFVALLIRLDGRRLAKLLGKTVTTFLVYGHLRGRLSAPSLLRIDHL